MAEREGFEPSRGCYPSNGLANRRLKPLGHLSTGLNGPSGVSRLRRLDPTNIIFFSFGSLVPTLWVESHTATSQKKDKGKSTANSKGERRAQIRKKGTLNSNSYGWLSSRTFGSRPAPHQLHGQRPKRSLAMWRRVQDSNLQGVSPGGFQVHCLTN